MLSIPICDDKALILGLIRADGGLGRKGYLETKFRLQDTIEGLAILAPVRVVDPLVRAHDTASASKQRILEGPATQLVSLDQIAQRRVTNQR
jgi:hypothetical protein